MTLRRSPGAESVSIGLHEMNVKKGRVHDRREFPRSVVVESWNGLRVRYVPAEAWRED